MVVVIALLGVHFDEKKILLQSFFRLVEGGEKSCYSFSEVFFRAVGGKVGDLVYRLKFHQGKLGFVVRQIRFAEQVVGVAVPRFFGQDLLGQLGRGGSPALFKQVLQG